MQAYKVAYTFAAMNTLSIRLKQARKHAKLTQKALADKVKVSQPVISQLENGENLQSVHLLAIANACGVNPAWLANGVGEMLPVDLADLIRVKELNGLTTPTSPYPRTPSEEDFVLIPQLSVVGECGDGHLNGHIEIEGGLAFRRDWLTKLSVKPEHCRALYAEGASMEPYIFEDDIVLVDTSDRLPKDRTPYAIRRADGGISFKRLIRQLSGTWLLRSDNPDKAMYPDEEVSATAMHDIPIIGRIIWRGGQM